MNVAIVPAAGRASRLGRPKALLPLGGTLVIEAVLDTLERGGVERSLVVAAEGDDALLAHARARGSAVCIQSTPELGMLSSIIRALDILAPELDPADNLIVSPVDFPAVRPETVAALLESREGSPHPIALPYFRARRGHPLVISASLASEVEGLDLAVGLRQLLSRHPHTQVEVDDPGIHLDLDTWADYLAHIAR